MTSNKERGEQALTALDKELKRRDRKQKRGPYAVVAAAALAIVLIAGGIIFAATRDNGGDQTAQDNSSSQSSQPTTSEEYQPLAMKRTKPLPDTVTCQYNKTTEDAHGATPPPTDNISAKGTAKVALETSQGKIDLTLDREASPCTVNAITHLAQSGFYNNTVCHRLTTNGIHVLQCGDPTASGSGGPGFQFKNEYPTDETADKDKQTPLKYPRGSIAMANSGADTNGSQFFLNYQDSPLPPLYTYFGQIGDEGLKTLDKVAQAGVQGGAQDGQPAQEVKITKTTVS